MAYGINRTSCSYVPAFTDRKEMLFYLSDDATAFFGHFGIDFLYPKNLKSWPEARVKAPRIDDRKRVHIVNIDPFAIVDSRELSRMPAANF